MSKSNAKEFLSDPAFAAEIARLNGSADVVQAAERYAMLANLHAAKYGEGEFFSSPGRIEVCGNHTDHNNGKVLCSHNRGHARLRDQDGRRRDNRGVCGLAARFRQRCRPQQDKGGRGRFDRHHQRHLQILSRSRLEDRRLQSHHAEQCLQRRGSFLVGEFRTSHLRNTQLPL